jgi:thymidylate synthase ThyX
MSTTYPNAKHFEFEIIDKTKTDIQIISLTDKRTGFRVKTALMNEVKQLSSLVAFAGARYSRSSDSIEDIFTEIKDAGGNAQEKLAKIFRNYGHASVADMAQVFLYIEDIPQIIGARFFNETSIGGGQERSTRFQDFGSTAVRDLKNYIPILHRHDPAYLNLSRQFVELQNYSLSKYNKWVENLTKVFIQAYQVDQQDKKQLSALKARVFDTARSFLLNGVCNRTSLGWITSAREWARIISQFKANDDWQVKALGEQMEIILAPDPEFAKSINYTPEVPDLVRYTAGDETTQNSLAKLQQFLKQEFFESTVQFRAKLSKQELSVKLYDENYFSGLKVMAQNILSLYPHVDEDSLYKWLAHLSDEKKENLSQLVFEGFNHHKQMGNQYRVNTKSLLLNCSIAETRDLNRHRAWGRFIPLLAMQKDYYKALYEGYILPAYLTDNPKLKTVLDEFEKDLLGYYNLLQRFINEAKDLKWFNQSLFLELLPFAHNMKMWMHGSIKEASYMTKLRVRPGGHINYRILAYDIAKNISQSEPFLVGLDLNDNAKPDASSRSEFIDRS